MKTNQKFGVQTLSAEETKQLNGGFIFPNLIATIITEVAIIKHNIETTIEMMQETDR